MSRYTAKLSSDENSITQALSNPRIAALCTLSVLEKKKETPRNCTRTRLLTSAAPTIIDRNSATF
jgi:hypothetical protein